MGIVKLKNTIHENNSTEMISKKEMTEKTGTKFENRSTDFIRFET